MFRGIVTICALFYVILEAFTKKLGCYYIYTITNKHFDVLSINKINPRKDDNSMHQLQITPLAEASITQCMAQCALTVYP